MNGLGYLGVLHGGGGMGELDIGEGDGQGTHDGRTNLERLYCLHR